LLDTARIPITEIAATLGYAETSAFSRAFRRWSGVTPIQRRRRLRDNQAGERTAIPAPPRD
jgi:AraC-like DNA-binding protein